MQDIQTLSKLERLMASNFELRKFESGATRTSEEGKFDYEGFLSPLVIREFGAFMHKNRLQPDGTLRESDNWQKGIPLDAYMKSKWRHFWETWHIHRGGKGNIKESLCAELFNTMGYLHEILKDEQ